MLISHPTKELPGVKRLFGLTVTDEAEDGSSVKDKVGQWLDEIRDKRVIIAQLFFIIRKLFSFSFDVRRTFWGVKNQKRSILQYRASLSDFSECFYLFLMTQRGPWRTVWGPLLISVSAVGSNICRIWWHVDQVVHSFDSGVLEKRKT